MDHREIDRLSEGDPPAVELRVEQDGVFVQVRIGVADPTALLLLPGFWLDGPEPLFQDCKQALRDTVPEAYERALTIHGLFEKALQKAVDARGSPFDRQMEVFLAEDAQPENEVRRG